MPYAVTYGHCKERERGKQEPRIHALSRKRIERMDAKRQSQRQEDQQAPRPARNTDADSWVPPDWISATLSAMRAADAVAAAGLVEVVGWRAPASARRAYHALIEAGLHPWGHDHVYGANLAVRLDAYVTVGGFPARDHGEDHALVARLRSAAYRVATPRTPRVRTSGRTTGRCPDGLGALLGRLASQP